MKIGFGAPAAMEKLRITAPLVGFLMESGVVQNGETISLAGWTKLVAEPEIAIYLGTDVPAGADEATVRKSMAAIGPVFELADMVEPPENAERIVAGNILPVFIEPSDERVSFRLDPIGEVSVRFRAG